MSIRRLASLQIAMQQQGCDAYIISSLPNIRYLSGFSGSNALCIVSKSGSFFLTDSRYTAQSRYEVRSFKRIVTTNDLFEEVARRKLLSGCRKIGFESQSLTYAQYRNVKRLISGVTLLPTRDVVESLLLVKEKKEIEHIRAAVLISDLVFGDLLRSLKPGVAELDIAAEISYLHKKNGAEKDAFEPIVASGERGSLPHARASSKRMKNGEFVTLDFGCTVKGYNSDITRTIAIGKVSSRLRKMYNAVRQAQSEAIGVAKGGIWAKDLDAVARERISKEGYGKFFNHSLGHGLGLQVHERPRVSSTSKERLVAGSVITIEPGVYIPGFGGVRIEDDVLLTADGCEVLNAAPKELMII